MIDVSIYFHLVSNNYVWNAIQLSTIAAENFRRREFSLQSIFATIFYEAGTFVLLASLRTICSNRQNIIKKIQTY